MHRDFRPGDHPIAWQAGPCPGRRPENEAEEVERMGHALSWLAVRGAPPEELLARLGLRATGNEDAYFETPAAGGPLEPDWYLIVSNRGDEIIAPSLLSELSRSYELVACFVEEHVMYSSAAGWLGGDAVWSLAHDSSRGIFDLEVSGEPPGLAAHRERCTAEQTEAGGEKADVDYLFDVPLLVAKDLTGFKHDEDIECLERSPLEALERLRRRRWFRFGS